MVIRTPVALFLASLMALGIVFHPEGPIAAVVADALADALHVAPHYVTTPTAGALPWKL